MTKRRWGIVGIGVVILVIATYVFFRGTRTAPSETVSTPTALPSVDEATSSPIPTLIKSLAAKDIPNAANDFQFQAEIPVGWEAAAITANDSLVLYDPNASGESSLEKAQVFIRSFRANTFLTLSTVTIHSRVEQTYRGRPAIRYDIEKKAGVADFASQPSWRNQRHIVTDIRVSDTNPSVFYVIAKRPDLAESTYQEFLQSLVVTSQTITLMPPTEEFVPRITVKNFGQLIDPKTSPVQPERFSGYHTGVDVEYADVTSDVPVYAITDGTILRATTVDGYGGVAVVRHTIEGAARAVVYGHIDPARLPKVGTTVKAGDIIAYLGRDKTAETDGERKHLHFAILRAETIDLRGYVTKQADLNSWINPLDYY